MGRPVVRSTMTACPADAAASSASTRRRAAIEKARSHALSDLLSDLVGEPREKPVTAEARAARDEDVADGVFHARLPRGMKVSDGVEVSGWAAMTQCTS
jgi:hypothetical protein